MVRRAGMLRDRNSIATMNIIEESLILINQTLEIIISNNGFSVRCAMTTRRYHSISSHPGDSPLLLAPQKPLLSFMLLTHTSF